MVILRDIRLRVERIQALVDEGESPHGDEDELYLYVLTAIANGTALDPQQLACEALKSSKIEFERWEPAPESLLYLADEHYTLEDGKS